jgi:hypothetical protein
MWITQYNPKKGLKVHIPNLCNTRNARAFAVSKRDVTCKRCLIELSHYRPWKQEIIVQRPEMIKELEKENFCCQIGQV